MKLTQVDKVPQSHLIRAADLESEDAARPEKMHDHHLKASYKYQISVYICKQLMTDD